MKYKVKEYIKSSLSEYCPYLEIIDDTMLAKKRMKNAMNSSSQPLCNSKTAH